MERSKDWMSELDQSIWLACEATEKELEHIQAINLDEWLDPDAP